MVVCCFTGIETSSAYRETDHDAEMEGFADAFEDGVDAEADVVEGYLEPGEPEEREEADVGFDG